MPDLFVALMVAFVLLVFAIALLAIGWLIKSRTKTEGTCEQNPPPSKEENNLFK